jgi:hypothetical protein
MPNTANERDKDKSGGGGGGGANGSSDDDYHDYDDICQILICRILFTAFHLYFSLFLFNFT